MNRILRWLHPVGFVVWVVLLNYRLIQPFVGWKEFLATLCLFVALALGLLLALHKVIKQPDKAAVLATWWILVFGLSTFHLKILAQALPWLGLGNQIGGAGGAAILMTLTLLGSAIILRHAGKFRILQPLLVTVSALLLLITLEQLAWHPRRLPAQAAALPMAQAPRMASDRPDIYFLVLDSHPSQEALQEFWQHDNRQFTQELKNLGFHVVRDARSRYTKTAHCIYACLNVQHVPTPYDEFPAANEMLSLYYGIQHSAVVELLRRHNYELVNLSLFPLADQPPFYEYAFSDFRRLRNLVLEGSIWHYYRTFWWQRSLRQTNLAILERLAQLPAQPAGRPRFVYAHVLMPHAPYCFARDGALRMRGLSQPNKEDFLDQLIYTDKVILPLLRRLQRDSKKPPVIIVCGDHGFRQLPGPDQERDRESHMVLNAIYDPRTVHPEIPAQMATVNTLRHVLNEYLGTDLPELPADPAPNALLREASAAGEAKPRQAGGSGP